MPTTDIFNYFKINDHLSTGGQPTAEQLRDAATEGFTAVINLAGRGVSRTLDGEAEIVQALGMTYYPIPVDWENPQASDFAAFERTMRQLSNAKILLHCAANYRVTAFYSLYAQKHLRWSQDEAIALRQEVWDVSEYPIWERFIAEMVTNFDQT